MIFACRSFSPPKQPVQPARRIPARLSSHHVSTTGHAAHPSFPLRCSARPSRPLLGPAFVRFLGWATAAHPAAGKCLSFQSSNFAEVAFGTRDLTQNRSMNSYEIALQLRNSGSAAFRAKSPNLRDASLMEYGLRGTLPTRPMLTPYIRFLFIDSHFCLTLPSDLTSRR